MFTDFSISKYQVGSFSIGYTILGKGICVGQGCKDKRHSYWLFCYLSFYQSNMKEYERACGTSTWITERFKERQ